MIDPFSERRFPGDGRVPSAYAVTDWEDVVLAPEWEGSTLRARLLYAPGRSTQLGANLFGEVPIGETLLGTLSLPFRPNARRHFILTISSGRFNALGDLGIETDGSLTLRPRTMLTDPVFRVVYALA